MVSACPGQFPKTDGCDRLYAEDVNLLYGNFIGMRSTEAETAMNIAKLQYCNSIQDINHDYMVVDVFTDSSGYNNTICTACTTSTYYNSELNGIYSNYYCINYNPYINNYYSCCYHADTTTPSPTQCICAVNSRLSSTYSITLACISSAVSIYTCGKGCFSTNFNKNFSNVKYFCFCINCNLINSWGCWSCSACIVLSSRYCIFGSNDDTSCNINSPNCHTGGSNNINITNCYAYQCLSSTTWCFYCNGTGKCCVTLTDFPSICFDTYVCLWQCIYSVGQTNSGTSTLCICNFCVCGLGLSNINIVPIIYSSPTKITYLDLDKYGTGTVVYNVIDSSTGNCIACNLLPKTLYNLDCCVQCHRYEIIQCSDGVSCIKSYAIVTGVY